MDRIAGYLGHVILDEEGAVITSGGEMENDEKSSAILFKMVHIANKRDMTPTDPSDSFKRISVHYPDHVYLITLSNRKVHVLKKKHIPHDPIHV